jgi:hypothetical protein
MFTIRATPGRRSSGARAALPVWLLLCTAAGCNGCEKEPDPIVIPPEPTVAPSAASAAAERMIDSAKSAVVEVMPKPRCPPAMVKVTPSGAQPFCVDRYEAMLVDHQTGARISPYYPPDRKLARFIANDWEDKRRTMGGPEARKIPLPTLPAWQQQKNFKPRAQSRKAVTPNGYTSGVRAIEACRHAAKRLCTPEEWRTACGGEQGWDFPYGPEYVQGKCNVFREAHPAVELHDDASMGHTDPRLNRVVVKGRPLLRKTGATPSCASRWGDDAIYDMVGNLDEWIDDPGGSFAGGFYARSTREGCKWRSTAHVPHYADYSTGVRCCDDLPEVRVPGINAPAD